MPVEYYWYDEQKTIAVCRMSRKWTWEDFYEARQAFRATVTHNPPRVDLILEITHDSVVPSNFVTGVKSAVASASKNWSMSVLVNPSAYVRSLFNVLSRTYPEIGRRYPIASSYEEAQALIEQYRSSLNHASSGK